MKLGFKLIVVSDAGDGVREFHVSRTALLALAVGVVLLVGVLALSIVRTSTAASAESTERPRPEPSVAPRELEPPAPAPLASAPVPSADLPTLATEEAESACGADMILVEGEFCPEVKHRCLRREDPEDSVLRALRCHEYERPATCLSSNKRTLRFCMDRDEYQAQGETLAKNFASFEDAKLTCSQQGKRLCDEDEWVFACEGEEMRPYPYGFERDAKLCNADRVGLVTPKGELVDLRAPKAEHSHCLSPFGVQGLTGNVEEFVLEKGGDRPLRKGAYWQPGANHCRARATLGRADYRGVETGIRCCKDAPHSGQ